MKIPIVGTGTAVYDILLKLTGFPIEDEAVGVIEQKTQGGGMTAIAMAVVSRLGVECAFFGNLGDDDTGRKILQGLIDEGINVDGVEMLPGYVNTVSYVLINSKNGSRTFLANKENTPEIELSDVRKQLIDNAEILHIDGGHYEDDIRIAQYAREKGVTVSYDACRAEREIKNGCISTLTAIGMNAAALATVPISGKSRRHRCRARILFGNTIKNRTGQSIKCAMLWRFLTTNAG